MNPRPLEVELALLKGWQVVPAGGKLTGDPGEKDLFPFESTIPPSRTIAESNLSLSRTLASGRLRFTLDVTSERKGHGQLAEALVNMPPDLGLPL